MERRIERRLSRRAGHPGLAAVRGSDPLAGHKAVTPIHKGAEPALPPLPQAIGWLGLFAPDGERQEVYTAEQMRAYALAALRLPQGTTEPDTARVTEAPSLGAGTEAAERPALLRSMVCEDCDGRGTEGEDVYQGEFQPPERYPCSSCGGSGKWSIEDDITENADYLADGEQS